MICFDTWKFVIIVEAQSSAFREVFVKFLSCVLLVCPQSAEMVKVVLTGGSHSIAALCREDLSVSWFPCARIECPLIYAFFIPFFRWDWGVVIRKLWPWLELRQCGCSLCFLNLQAWPAPPRPAPVTLTIPKWQLPDQAPRGQHVGWLLGSFLCVFGQIVKLSKV